MSSKRRSILPLSPFRSELFPACLFEIHRGKGVTNPIRGGGSVNWTPFGHEFKIALFVLKILPGFCLKFRALEGTLPQTPPGGVPNRLENPESGNSYSLTASIDSF